MKKLFLSALLALTSVAFGATTTPVSLINPAGSTAGQAIISSGPSSAPVWGAVPLTGITGTLAITNGGTGATSASAARTALGVPSTGANTFTGNQTIAVSSGSGLTVNDTSSTSHSNVYFQAGGTNLWGIRGNWSNSQFQINRYVSGTLTDTPLVISNSTGVATFTQRPVFGAATPWDSGNLNFASPPNIGLTTPAVGSFSALNATGNDALLYSYSGAQSIANNTATTVAGFTKVYDRLNANFNATTGTFTAPATGYYQVGGSITFSTATGVASAIYQVTVVANGTIVATGRVDQGSTASTAVQVPIPFTVVSLTAGQTIIFQVTQNTGVSRSLSTAAGSVAINRLP